VEKKEYYYCEGGSQLRSLSQRFPFVFAFKETPGWPEVSRRLKTKSLNGCIHRRQSATALEYKNSYPG